MPNQYTKFRAAGQNLEAREFRWRQYSTEKPHRWDVKTKKRSSPSSCRSSKTSPHTSKEACHDSLKQAQCGPSETLLQYLPSGGLRVDPFRSYPVAPDRSELAVLDYFLHILAPSGKQNYNVAKRRPLTHVDPHINLLLPYVMQEPPLFDSMLATCQASILLSGGLSALNDRFFVEHRGRAMVGLREKLAGNAIDTTALLSVAMLLTCDHLIGDLQAVLGHAKALHRMSGLREPLPTATRWDRFVKAGVEAYKSIAYMTTGVVVDESSNVSPLNRQVDTVIPLEYPQPPSSSESCKRWSQLPSGFSDLILSHQISTQLVDIMLAISGIDDAADIDFLATQLQIHPIQAALHRFSQHMQATYLERCIAAGLLAYTFQYPRMQTLNLFHDPSMQGFIRLLSIRHQAATRAEHDVLIWVFVVVEAVMASRASRLPGSKDLYLQATNKFPAMRNWSNTLEAILKQFFHTSQSLDHWRFCHTTMLGSLNADETHSSSPASGANLSIDSDLTGEEPLVCPFSGKLSGSSSGASAICPFRP